MHARIEQRGASLYSHCIALNAAAPHIVAFHMHTYASAHWDIMDMCRCAAIEFDELLFPASCIGTRESLWKMKCRGDLLARHQAAIIPIASREGPTRDTHLKEQTDASNLWFRVTYGGDFMCQSLWESSQPQKTKWTTYWIKIIPSTLCIQSKFQHNSRRAKLFFVNKFYIMHISLHLVRRKSDYLAVEYQAQLHL